MSPPRRTTLDTSARGLQRLYFRILLGAMGMVLLLQLVLRLALEAGAAFTIEVMVLYAAVVILAWIGYESVRDVGTRMRQPKGFVLGTLSLLLVLLCADTGGISSPFYMLLFTTCVFAALLMDAFKAFVLTSVAAVAYVVVIWLTQTNGIGLAVFASPKTLLHAVRTAPLPADEMSALVVHCFFLYLGTYISVRLSSGFRARVVRLETHATRDPLTGLPNRRGFTEKLALETERASQWDWPIAILVMDLDHFKKVNDRFGHNIGDDVLVGTAKLLRESAGPLDHLARLGGEEFAVAAVGADRRHGAELADRIVRSFRTNDWGRIQPGLTLTCSVGVAVRHPGRDEGPLDDFAGLIEKADRALMHVKESGRDGYLVSGDTPPPPPPKGPLVAPRPPGEDDRPPKRLRMIRR